MDVGHGRGIRWICSFLIVGVTALLVTGCGGSASSRTTSQSTTAAAASGGTGREQAKRSPQVRVPKVVGERYGLAVHELHEAGLVQHAPGFTGTIGNPRYNGDCKKIITQAPPAGTRLPKGGTVAIVYGVCPRAVAAANPG
jgi:PASTA domain-containing protein